MHSLQEYCKRQSTERLEEVLQAECEGRESLPAELILLICAILLERDADNSAAQKAIGRLYENDL